MFASISWLERFVYRLVGEARVRKVHLTCEKNITGNKTAFTVTIRNSRTRFTLSLTDGCKLALSVTQGWSRYAYDPLGRYSDFTRFWCWDLRSSNPRWNPEVVNWMISPFNPTAVENDVRKHLVYFGVNHLS